MKRAALYVRVSTQEQAQEGYSIGEQRERLIAYCKAHNWSIADIYVDSGYSGSNLKRPAIQKLMNETDKFDVVLVYKLDRLSRSQRDTLYLIEEIFLPHGVDFVSMQESFDTSSPFGRAMIGLLAVFAQLEREQIKERTFMGRVARAKQGLFHGGGSTPTGYDYRDGRLIINPYEADKVRKIFKWYLAGMSMNGIAKKLNEIGYTNQQNDTITFATVRRILVNQIYIGRIHFKEISVENAHEPLVSLEDFQKVQIMMAQRYEQYGKNGFQSRCLLTGMLICGKCGARYITHGSKKYAFYSCYSRCKKTASMIKDPNCKNKNWRKVVLEKLVKDRVREVITSPQIVEELISSASLKPVSVNQDVSRIKQRIHELDKQIGKLMDLYQVDGIPIEVLSEKINALYHEKTVLESSTTPVKEENKSDSFDLFRELIADAAQIWDFADDGQKRRIMQGLIKRIVLTDEDVAIEWAI